MKNFLNYLIRHKNKYNKITLIDYFKLIYQSEYAGGHMIKSKNDSLNYLSLEISSIIPNDNKYLYEYISSNMIRINLEPFSYFNNNINELNNLFFDSSNLIYKGLNLIDKANLLYNIGYNDDSILDFKNNPKAFHHSNIYNESYNPHYRVINTILLPIEYRILKLKQFLNRIDKNKLTIISIEGKCTSGKTSITSQIDDATIIHADDFFSKTDVLDFKLMIELIEKLEINKSIQYKCYDCQTDTYYYKNIDNVKPIVIIEGVYSYSPILRKYYDYLIYTEVTADIQINRLNERKLSKYLYDKFINEWIIRENKYYDENDYIAIADLII